MDAPYLGAPFEKAPAPDPAVEFRFNPTEWAVILNERQYE